MTAPTPSHSVQRTVIRSRRRMIVAVALVGGLLASACDGGFEEPSPYAAAERGAAPDDDSAGAGRAKFGRPQQRMPSHGALLWLDSASNTAVMQDNIKNGGYGTLAISVPPGGKTYYVKLKELSPARREALGVVIAPGRTYTVKVPLDGTGTTVYDLHYGAGSRWYGRKHTFGPTGAYARADETFAFEQGTGWEVELILQTGGNLGTSGLGYQNF